MKKIEEDKTRKKTLKEKLNIFGPGAVITGSFVGIGTLTTSTEAGASYGYTLLWAVLLSIITAIVLQVIVARIGIVTQEGLGVAIREQFSHPWIKYTLIWLVVISITLGAATYISSDLTGTSLGITTFVDAPVHYIAPVMGVIVLLLGLIGGYKAIEKLILVLIVIMCISFVTTMFVVQPDWGSVFKGTLVPEFPKGSSILIIAMVGTTVVPYNFFVHASTVQSKWKSPSQLNESRWDTIISISVGGLVTAAILVTAATIMPGESISNATDLAVQLEPVFGSWAKIIIGSGIFAAGISSAVVVPLGAVYTIGSAFKWKGGLSNKRLKFVFIFIVLIGIVVSGFGIEPLSIVLFAQALNGILLPVIAVLIMIVSNNKRRLGKYTNTLALNIIGGIICVICAVLGIQSLIDAITSFMSIF